MTDERLLALVAETVARRPHIVPGLLEAVQEGMAGWKAAVEAKLDAAADHAIMAALMLPKSSRHWTVKKHGDIARMLYVGWNLQTREAGSPLEKEVVTLVAAADKADPEGSARHYSHLVGPL